MKPCFAGLVSLIGLVACSSQSPNDTNDEASEFKLYGAKVAATRNELPVCDSTQTGQLFYALEQASFYFCSAFGYALLDLHGEDGAPGLGGAHGQNGTDGADGRNGASCSVSGTTGVKTITCGSTEAVLRDGESCRVETTLIGYDLTCGSTTVSIANGKDGAHGVDGANGADGEDGLSCMVSDNGLGTLNQTCGSISVTWPKALCGDVAYDPATQLCSADDELSLLSTAEQCGLYYYDPAHFSCLAGRILATELILDCNGVQYNKQTHACLDNNVVDIATVEFCREVAFDPDQKFCDTRDGHLYGFTQIGNANWMTQNLNFAPSSTTGNWCYNDISANCEEYGRLYNWAAAMDLDASYNATTNPTASATIQGLCPDGWHLPSLADWQALTTETDARTLLNIVASGERRFSENDFYSLGAGAFWWSSTELSGTEAYRAVDDGVLDLQSNWLKEQGHSIRCLQAVGSN